MTRVHLTTDKKKWFNIETAERFDEATYWDGNNHISKITDSQFKHEILFKTKSGNWILNKYSQYSGDSEVWKIIKPNSAMEWLIENEHHSVVDELFGDDVLKEYEV